MSDNKIVRGMREAVEWAKTAPEAADNAFLLRELARELDSEAEDHPCSEAEVCRDSALEIERMRKALQEISTGLEPCSHGWAEYARQVARRAISTN